MRHSPLRCAVFAAALLVPLAGSPLRSHGAGHRQAAPPGEPASVWLDTLNLARMTAGWGRPLPNRSCENAPLRLHGVTHEHGVGTHAVSEAAVDLHGSAERFEALAGLDDERAGAGSIRFEVWVDDRLAARSPVMRGREEPFRFSVNLHGARRMLLLVDDAGDGINNDHADWAEARIVLAPGATRRPQIAALPAETPLPISMVPAPDRPAIHGPRIVGTTPGRPFLFRIPATGKPPLVFAAVGLPGGLRVDARTGIVDGAVSKPGRYRVRLSVRGPAGTGSRTLTVVAQPGSLALTPPMGWNSWYVWFGGVDGEKVRQAADAMVTSGLAAHGWQYVCIDDCWEGARDANGEIQANAKFGDMAAVANHVHTQGLKFGIYSSPGPKTCAGFEGSYQHEAQDAATYARWGVDLLKYDWCSYGNIAGGNDVAHFRKPYETMQAAMAGVDRDMVYSLCQYGMGDVWKWGAEVGGNFWRTTGDSGDTWGAVSGIGFRQAGLEKYAGPGHWNDPDMLMVGKLGGGGLHQTSLTPNEQIAQMTLWTLIAAPLLLSCDLAKLDKWTLALLTNDEVIDVNQDTLGKAAGRRSVDGMREVWARPLADGTLAVGLFNRGLLRSKVTARWADLGLKGPQPVRDLWQRKNLGVMRGEFAVEVPAHGAVLVKIGRPAKLD